MGMLGISLAFYFLTFSSRTSLVMCLERGIVLNPCLFLFRQDEQTKQIFQMRLLYNRIICCIFLKLCLCNFSSCFNHLCIYWKATAFFSAIFGSSVFNRCETYPWESVSCPVSLFTLLFCSLKVKKCWLQGCIRFPGYAIAFIWNMEWYWTRSYWKCWG